MTISATPISPARKEVAFIDTAVADWQTLVDDIRPDVEVVLLDGSRDGLTLMVEWAQTHHGYDAVHVFSHGAPGRLILGAASLDSAALDTRSADLTLVGNALQADGDILLYGCSVGADGTLVENMAKLTQADIAASTDVTGAAAQGGNWQLEVISGEIDVPALAPAAFAGLLADATFDFGTDADSTGAVTQTDTANGETITFTVTNGDGNLYFAEDASADTNGLLGSTDFTNMSGRVMFAYDDVNCMVNTVRISVTGKTFDLESFSFYDFMEAGSTITLTSDKGSTTFTANIGLIADLVNLAANSHFQGVSYVDVTSSGAGFSPLFDNVALTNITAPAAPDTNPPVLNFGDTTGGNTFIEGGSAVGIDSDVTVSDTELDALNSSNGDYSGASITIVRNGGANADDVFGNKNSLGTLTEGQDFDFSSTTVGTVTTNSSGTLTLTFNSSANSAIVDEVLQNITYANSSDAPPSSVSLDWTFNDGTNNSTATQVPVSITPTNDAPVMSTDARSLTAIAEDPATNTGTLVSTILSSAGTPTDADSANIGIAVTGVTDTNGVWQYSTDGSSWTAFADESVAADSARLLADDDWVRFVPGADYNGTDTGSISFKAWDQSSGLSGSTGDTTSGTAYSANSATATISVTAVNDAPTDISLSNASVTIYDGTNATVGTLSSTDVDTGDTHSYTLVSGDGDTDNASFNISGDTLRATNASGLSADSYSVRIRTTDNGTGSLTYEEAFAITVTDTLAVTTNSDSGVDATTGGSYAAELADGDGLSLREALALASAGNKTIGFDGGLNGQTITLASAAAVPDATTLNADDANSLTIAGSPLQLAGGLSLSNGAGDSLTVSAPISDDSSSFSLTKNGAGTLALSGNNGYDGTTTVNAGTLAVAADTNLGSGAFDPQ